MKYKYFVFDLDGTLLDTSEGIFDALEATLQDLSLPNINRKDMGVFIGPQLSDSFNHYLNLKGDELNHGIAVFRENYQKLNSAKKAEVYKGNFDLLNFIKENGGTSSVATFKYEPLAVSVLQDFKLRNYFAAIGGSPKMGGATKKDLIETALYKMGCRDLSQSVMLGDTYLDGSGAKDAKVDFIGCMYGFGNEEQLLEYNPVLVAKKPLDIIEFIKR